MIAAHVVNAHNKHLYENEFDEFLRRRQPSPDGSELDQFDTDAATYLLCSTRRLPSNPDRSCGIQGEVTCPIELDIETLVEAQRQISQIARTPVKGDVNHVFGQIDWPMGLASRNWGLNLHPKVTSIDLIPRADEGRTAARNIPRRLEVGKCPFVTEFAPHTFVY
ncbi:hypothetical protein [Mesorhizobium sp. WSM3626]|uniref:hypothetical protein n=1 Tax=Mesorhizobium sp. WSM3626 TaxID=1040987 RepID=UPI0004820111|nr:hypothetical protein [Mesorhizobium sp. WSM3626]